MSGHIFKFYACCVSLVWGASISGYSSNVSASQDKNQESGNVAAVEAVGAVVSSLVFDADAGEAATQPAKNADQLKESLGAKSLESLEALTSCNHALAFNYARQASASANSDFALSGLWLEALTEADRKNWFEAKAYFPKIRSRDQDIHSQSDYDTALNQALKEISAARQEHGSASSCKR